MHCMKLPKFAKALLLIILLVFVLAAAWVIIMQGHLSCNLFFRYLTSKEIESIVVFGYNSERTAELSQEEIEELVPMLNKIRLKEELCEPVLLVGGHGPQYHIKLRNGTEFDFTVDTASSGAYYTFDEKMYYAGSGDDPDSADDVENAWHIRELFEGHLKEYFPELFVQ